MRIIFVIAMIFSPWVRAESADGELVPEGEAATIRQIVHLVEGRGEPKSHGCVTAQFSVIGGLPPDLAQGVFAQTQIFPAEVRFTTTSPFFQDDRQVGGLGMAIKLYGVSGPKLLADDHETDTQDFVMFNSPVYFLSDAAEYLKFEETGNRGALNISLWTIMHPVHSHILYQTNSQTVIDPLNASYWSQTASCLGPEHQMKFAVEPCPGTRLQRPDQGRDRIQDNLRAYLASHDACFDFKVQLRTRPATMSVEDPSTAWDEKQAPFSTVARILIPAQSPLTGSACDHISFTPWHSLIEHRPLGGISRVREALYLNRFGK